jgi:hypothetical protein
VLAGHVASWPRTSLFDQGREVEIVIDPDGRVTRGQCNCSHYFRFKLRAGPCRHMQALRREADGARPTGTLEQWYRMLMG